MRPVCLLLPAPSLPSFLYLLASYGVIFLNSSHLLMDISSMYSLTKPPVLITFRVCKRRRCALPAVQKLAPYCGLSLGTTEPLSDVPVSEDKAEGWRRGMGSEDRQEAGATDEGCPGGKRQEGTGAASRASSSSPGVHISRLSLHFSFWQLLQP